MSLSGLYARLCRAFLVICFTGTNKYTSTYTSLLSSVLLLLGRGGRVMLEAAR